MKALETLRSYVPATRRQAYVAIGVFVAYFVVAKFGLYLYFTFNTSPALIWPPVGVALAAMVFYGYRMWVPILLAQFFVTLLQSPNASMLLLFVIAAGFALQAVVGLYVMRVFKFEPRFDTLTNALVIVFVALVVTAIEPSIATGYQFFSGTLNVTPLLNWTRAWGAGIFSVLVFTTLIISWFPWQKFNYSLNEKLEIIFSFSALTALIYLLFWTKFSVHFGIAVIFFLPAVLIWLALRLNVRWLTLAVLWTSILGVTGSIITTETVKLSAQLLANEVYIALVSAMVLIFVSIVGERRTAFEGMKDALNATIQADKNKTEFIAVLAHELRNPLAPIVSSLELLKLQPQTREAVLTINSAQEHTTMIRRLLDDLLDTARLSQNKFKLQKETISLRKIVDQCVGNVSEFYRKRNHALTVTLPKEEIILNADPVRFKQIIINLLNNAGKYTKSGGKIELVAGVEENVLTICVSDNGIGIERDMLNNIFEPFKQAEQMSKQGAGLGIGLFLTKSLVEMHGGKIFALSEGLGKGSVFRIFIPLIPQENQVLQVQKRETAFKSGPASRILIVDDNEPAASALSKLLEYHGHTIQTAFSGTDALSKVSIFKPQFILLDLGMPDMDGFEVASKLKEQGWNGTLVALTGYGQETDRAKTKEAGFQHHLVKPVRTDDILSVIVGD